MSHKHHLVVILALAAMAPLQTSEAQQAQWRMTIGPSSHQPQESRLYGRMEATPSRFFGVRAPGATGVALRVERGGPGRLALGATLTYASVDYLGAELNSETLEETIVARRGSGSHSTVLAHAALRLTPSGWPTRLDVTGGIGLVRLDNLQSVDPESSAREVRPAGDIGVRITQPITSGVGIQFGYSQFYYQQSLNRAGITRTGEQTSSRTLHDRRFTLGVTFPLR